MNARRVARSGDASRIGARTNAAKRVELPAHLVQVGQLLVQRHSYAEIAEQLQKTVNTIRSYAHELYQLTHASGRRELAAWHQEHPEAFRTIPTKNRHSKKRQRRV